MGISTVKNADCGAKGAARKERPADGSPGAKGSTRSAEGPKPPHTGEPSSEKAKKVQAVDGYVASPERKEEQTGSSESAGLPDFRSWTSPGSDLSPSEKPLEASVAATENTTELGDKAYHVANAFGAMLAGDRQGAWAMPYLQNTARQAWEEEYGRGQGLSASDAPQDYLDSWVDAWSGGDTRIPLAGALNSQMAAYGVKDPTRYGAATPPPAGNTLAQDVMDNARGVASQINASGGYVFDGKNDCYGFVQRAWNPILESQGQAALPVADGPRSQDWAPIDWDQLKPGDVLSTSQGHQWGDQWHGGLYAGKDANGNPMIFDCSSSRDGAYQRQGGPGLFNYYYQPTHEMLENGGTTAPVAATNPRNLPASPAASDPPASVDAQTAARMLPGASQANIDRYLPQVERALSEQGLGDSQMTLAALATIGAESAGFEPISEYQSSYNTAAGGRPYGKYDFRADLGNGAVGDGERYKGRGFIQLTGKANYQRYGEKLGMGDALVRNPELANDPEVASRLLAVYLKDHEAAIRSALDRGDYASARAQVNGGSNGLLAFQNAYQTGASGLVA